MYEYIMETVLSIRQNFKEIIIVTQYEEIERALEQYQVRIIRNTHSDWGISYSLKLGLDAVQKSPENAYLFFVGDQPYLTRKTISGLLEGWKRSPKGLGCVAWGRLLGNPAIFAEQYREELESLCGDKGGKVVIRKHLEDLYLYEAEDVRELQDIDSKPVY